MGAQLRIYRRRIKSVQQTKKITKAMELIASSRIVKAQQRLNAALPYTRELVLALSAAVSMSAQKEFRFAMEATKRKRAAVLLIGADRGLAGAYSSNIIREGEALNAYLRAEGVEPVHFLAGRKVVNYYRFRERYIEGEYTGFSDQPTVDDAREIALGLLASFLSDSDTEGGTDEIHVVYTHFASMVSQQARIRRILPLEVVDEVVERSEDAQPSALYEFEPDAESVLDGLLPQYIDQTVYSALLMSAASEHAARRRAMKSATDNAEEMIKSLSRQANQARQAEITQEISEIVGGADALSAAR